MPVHKRQGGESRRLVEADENGCRAASRREREASRMDGFLRNLRRREGAYVRHIRRAAMADRNQDRRLSARVDEAGTRAEGQYRLCVSHVSAGDREGRPLPHYDHVECTRPGVQEEQAVPSELRRGETRRPLEARIGEMGQPVCRVR